MPSLKIQMLSDGEFEDRVFSFDDCIQIRVPTYSVGAGADHGQKESNFDGSRVGTTINDIKDDVAHWVASVCVS